MVRRSPCNPYSPEADQTPGLTKSSMGIPGLTINRSPLGSRLLTVEFFARIPPGQTPGTQTNNLYVVTDSMDAAVKLVHRWRIPSTAMWITMAISPIPPAKIPIPYIVERSAALRGEKWIRSVAAAKQPGGDLATTFLPELTCPNGGTVGLAGSATNPLHAFRVFHRHIPENAFINNQFVPPPRSTQHWMISSTTCASSTTATWICSIMSFMIFCRIMVIRDPAAHWQTRRAIPNSAQLCADRFSSSAGRVCLPADFTIEYNTTTNPCRPEVFNQSLVC